MDDMAANSCAGVAGTESDAGAQGTQGKQETVGAAIDVRLRAISTIKRNE